MPAGIGQPAGRSPVMDESPVMKDLQQASNERQVPTSSIGRPSTTASSSDRSSSD